MLHSEIIQKILKSFYRVYNTLGYGFLEKVYENALFIELKKIGFNISQQFNIKVHCGGEIQLINYLKATDKEAGLLLNL